jgi:hypothetical protein
LVIRRKFQGKVVTLGDSCEADYLVIVRCLSCGAQKQMHPYRLIARRKSLAVEALETPLEGFHCKACSASVRATVSCTFERPGR